MKSRTDMTMQKRYGKRSVRWCAHAVAVSVVSFVFPFVLHVAVANAAIDSVPRSRGDFPRAETTTSETVRVAGVRVVMAEYELIARDFPQMKKRSSEKSSEWRERVDRWLVSETGFIAVEQARQSVVNSPIATLDQRKNAFRPKDYKRAHVIDVSGGLMDAKGTGASTPEQRHHGNGLATLGEMIREFIYEKAVDLIFEHSGINAKTVGNYAVLDYGFDVIHEDGSRSRAGYVLRQAHIRSANRISRLTKEQAFEVEKTLRKYGVTTSGETFAFRANGWQTQNFWDYTNVQGTNNQRTIEVIDFGSYLAVEKFEHRLLTHIDKSALMQPGDVDFKQPDSRLRLPLEMWGHAGVEDPKFDKPWVWSHELAQALAEGRADRSAADAHLRNFLHPIEKKIGRSRMCRRVFAGN